MATADGGLGFWAALEEVYPSTLQQRCWVHKTANVPGKLPKKLQGSAKERLRGIYTAPSRKDALKALDTFEDLFGGAYEKAVTCLRKDQEELLSFYQFPPEHWVHLRTSNPIESTFATAGKRTRQTKGCGSREATLMMVYKLTREAEKTLAEADWIAAAHPCVGNNPTRVQRRSRQTSRLILIPQSHAAAL